MIHSFDDSTCHVMRSFVRGDGYVILAWPKNSTLRDLLAIRGAVNFQLDTFIDSARRETEAEEAARLEVESWVIVPAGVGGETPK